MSDFTRGLLKDLQGSHWDVNPLVVIGLTEAILDLGLTQDQIYSVIRSFVRQLVAQVHPDRNPANVSPERQKDIFSAFQVLDDREKFNSALAEFRNLRAEDRREVKILGQTVRALRNQFVSIENRERALEEARKEFAQERQGFEQQKLTEPLQVPPLKAEVERLNKAIGQLTATVEKKGNTAASWKSRFADAATFIANLGIAENQSLFAFRASWVAVTAMCPDKDLSISDGDFDKAVRKIRIPEDAATRILKRWESVRKVFEPNTNAGKHLGLSMLRLQAGEITEVLGNQSFGGGRVIGSIPPDKVPIERARFHRTMGQEEVFNSFTPFLIPDGLMVHIQTSSGGKKAAWSMTCPAFRFNTRKLILGAG
jgi:hypothetical protein